MKLKTLAEIYNYTCYYCHKKFPLDMLSRDHYKPKSKGGKQRNNIVLCCIECNRRKADIPGHIYKETKRQTFFNVK